MAADPVPNKNFLSPLNFKFQLKRAPNLNFFIQKINLPGLNLPEIDVPNPIIRVPYPGEHLRYEDLRIEYKVDEDLQNYMELHGWIRSIGKRTFAEYKTIANKSSTSGEGIRSDISLTVLTSNKNANYEIIFRDAFPVSVSGIDFSTTDEDVQYVLASAEFKYLSYEVNKVS